MKTIKENHIALIFFLASIILLFVDVNAALTAFALTTAALICFKPIANYVCSLANNNVQKQEFYDEVAKKYPGNNNLDFANFFKQNYIGFTLLSLAFILPMVDVVCVFVFDKIDTIGQHSIQIVVILAVLAFVFNQPTSEFLKSDVKEEKNL